MTKDVLPNDWPKHLSERELFVPISEAVPAGCQTLAFERMGYKQFEQFCWWLIQKEHELQGCQHIGGSGSAQGGIDLFACDKFNPTQLVVFECKCWKAYDSSALRIAIDAFLAGPWSKCASKFVLVLAQESIGNLAETWVVQSAKLNERGIESEIWTGMQLTAQVQRFPDIVTKFFSEATARVFCNEWMQRVGFIERLHKALVDERAAIRTLASDFLSHSPPSAEGKLAKPNEFETWTAFGKIVDQRQEVERIYHTEDNWTINRPWVHLSCILPGKRFYPGSATIEIRKANTSGLVVVLLQKWLLSNILGGEGAPMDHEYRPFIVGESVHSSPKSFIIDLQNCRLSLPPDGMGELGYVVDKFSRVFADALVKLEIDWAAVDFPFVNQDGSFVAMCSMPHWLWQTILDFARAHDADSGDTEWHVFDAKRSSLKVYTTKTHVDFDLGYHGIFYARDDLDGLGFNDEVVVLWQPPDLFDGHVVDVRKWMPCAYALDWITRKLLPEVGKWTETREVNRRNLFERVKTKKQIGQWWKENAEVTDLREPPLLRNQRYRTKGLVATVEKLQGC